MHLLPRQGLARSLGDWSAGGLSSVAGAWSGAWRRWLLVAGLAGVAAQLVIVCYARTQSWFPLLSNLLQTALGFLAVLAMTDAGIRSGRFGRRTWFLSALAVAIYSVGQAIFTYSYTIAQPYSRHYGAVVYDPIFFFWAVPLVATALATPAEISEGFEWSSVLDVSLFVLLALALYFSAFVDSRWLGRPEEMLFWRFKVRLLRDLIVLGCLWGRFFFSDSDQVRALFLRLGTFYSAYVLCNITYLTYLIATGAEHVPKPDTWTNLVWSIPRVLAVALAVTWNWQAEIADRRPPAPRWRRRLLDRAPLVVPLLVIVVSAHMFSSAPFLWGGLIVATLGIVSLRLRLAQSRQERAVARLQSSTTLLHSIIEGTSESVYLKDAQGRYLLMNPAGARVLRLTPQEIVGKTDYQLFPVQDAGAYIKNDQKVMSSGSAVTAEEVVTGFGSERRFLTTKNPYRDSQGNIIGVLGISVDITERRRMEEHLQKAQRMESIGTFSSGMAHDFNNLLTVIKGYSYLAHAEGNPAVRESVDQINKAATRASSLIDQLLAFSRQQILQPRIINLNDIVSHLRKMLDRLIGEDVRIQTQFAHDLGTVKADPGQIEQVLMNLAANARDAMPGGGTLSMTTANVNLNRSNCGRDFHVPPGAYVRLTVSDTGIGMDAHTQARIFEPFFTTKPPGKGTGLGLATAYGIIKQSGGYWGVESEPKSGTTFRIYLPRVSQPAEPLSQTTSRSAPHGGHQTILIVDDDRHLRHLASDVLIRSGFKVLGAESAVQAKRIAALHEGPIHLLLTDVVLPGASGRQIAQQICANCSTGKTRVLYMSGYPNDAITHHGVIDEGVCLLKKPFSPERLVEKVREVLQDSGNETFSKTA